MTSFTVTYCIECDHKCLNLVNDGKGKVKVSPSDTLATMSVKTISIIEKSSNRLSLEAKPEITRSISAN